MRERKNFVIDWNNQISKRVLHRWSCGWWPQICAHLSLRDFNGATWAVVVTLHHHRKVCRHLYVLKVLCLVLEIGMSPAENNIIAEFSHPENGRSRGDGGGSPSWCVQDRYLSEICFDSHTVNSYRTTFYLHSFWFALLQVNAGFKSAFNVSSKDCRPSLQGRCIRISFSSILIVPEIAPFISCTGFPMPCFPFVG